MALLHTLLLMFIGTMVTEPERKVDGDNQFPLNEALMTKTQKILHRDPKDLFDTDDLGETDSKELKWATRDLGFQSMNEESQWMIFDLDDDESGTIGDGSLMIKSPKINLDSRDEIVKAIRPFNDDETGKISFENSKQTTNELGIYITDEELQEMIDETDRDDGGG